MYDFKNNFFIGADEGVKFIILFFLCIKNHDLINFIKIKRKTSLDYLGDLQSKIINNKYGKKTNKNH